MKFKIGFTAEKETEKKAPEAETKAPEEAPARESLVRVYFPQRGFDCTYYNNLFDLHVGDLVYVDGKLEGKRGKVIDVSYTFKIKLSDYKRVIAKSTRISPASSAMSATNCSLLTKIPCRSERYSPTSKLPQNPMRNM